MFLRAEIRRRQRRWVADDAGFTLLEVIVALLVLTIAASGTVLVLATGSHAAAASRLDTQGKDLGQLRVESMRDLPFHVDHQNGPFIDLLDLYYTNLSTTATSRTRGAITDTSDQDVKETQTVRWFSSGSAPNPSGPFFQVSVSDIPNYSGFSQVIDCQFLSASGTALPSSSFTGSGTYAGYDSQTEGADSPPTNLLGVTVITSWDKDGLHKSYTLSTEITDTRGTTSYITSQGVGEYLHITSNGPNATSTNFDSLTLDYLRAEAGGSQTTGSSATANVGAFEAVDTGQGQDVHGATGAASSPGSTTTSTPANATFAAEPSGVSGCGWATVGQTQVSDVTAATGSGLPQVPSDVGSTESTPAAQTTANQIRSGPSGCKGGLMSFDNQSASYLSTLLLGSTPLVSMQNPGGSGTATTGAAWVNSDSNATTPHWVSSGGSISTAVSSSSPNAACPLNVSGSSTAVTCVRVFPGLSFVNDGGGLVDIAISSASLTCTSTVPSGGGTPTYSATTAVTGAVSYWAYNSGSPHRVVIPLSSTLSGGTDPLAAVLASNPVVNQNGSTVLHLSDYISTWSSTQTVLQDSNSGLFQVPGVVNIGTTAVRSGDPTSSVGVEVGDLSCAAADDR